MSDLLKTTTFSTRTTTVTNNGRLRDEIWEELVQNILPYYTQHAIDEKNGGFYCHITNNNTVDKTAPKGLVQHSRLLWTFSHAHRQFGNAKIADHAYTFLREQFWDVSYGGFHWFVDDEGRPLQSEKYVYGQAFAIYGLSEYVLATRNAQGLEMAVSVYELLEKHAHDPEYGGYFELFSPNWQQRLSDNVDEIIGPVAKTMNTHLHVLEAYTNLLRIWPDKALKESLHKLIRLHLDQIINQKTSHLRLHFTADWQSLHDGISYGHDIEASWLLVEAAEVLGNKGLLAEVTAVALHMAQICYDEGIDSDGGLLDAPDNATKEWWPQAEAMVGFFNAYQLSQKTHFLDAFQDIWAFTKEQIIDRQNGEWFWGRQLDGTLMDKEKVGPWKTPYHNGRACLELLSRLPTRYNKRRAIT